VGSNITRFDTTALEDAIENSQIAVTKAFTKFTVNGQPCPR
jgi:hypothetical protein